MDLEWVLLYILPSHTCMKRKMSARYTGNRFRVVHHIVVPCAMRSTGTVTGRMWHFFGEPPTPVCQEVLQSADITLQHLKCTTNVSISQKLLKKCIPFLEVLERKRMCLYIDKMGNSEHPRDCVKRVLSLCYLPPSHLCSNTS